MTCSFRTHPGLLILLPPPVPIALGTPALPSPHLQSPSPADFTSSVCSRCCSPPHSLSSDPRSYPWPLSSSHRRLPCRLSLHFCSLPQPFLGCSCPRMHLECIFDHVHSWLKIFPCLSTAGWIKSSFVLWWPRPSVTQPRQPTSPGCSPPTPCSGNTTPLAVTLTAGRSPPLRLAHASLCQVGCRTREKGSSIIGTPVNGGPQMSWGALNFPPGKEQGSTVNFM